MRLRGWQQQTLKSLCAAEVQEEEPLKIERAHFDGQLIRK
jgi:hypothetical protein